MTTKTIPERKDVAASDQWDLSPLFDTDDAWEQAFNAVQTDLEGYSAYQGRLGESAAVLQEAIEFDLDLSRRLERLYTYAHLKNDEDKSNQVYLGLYQRAVSLYTRASELSSFMRPEIMAVDEERMTAFRESAELADYRFYLEKILRLREHTRTPAEEELLAMSREMAQTAGQVFGQLDNVDLKFGTLADDQGREMELSHGNFTTFLQNPARNVRRQAFFQYYERYEQHKNTVAAALGGSIKGDLFYARSRRYDDCRAAALFSDRMPAAVYDNLITTVRGNLAPLFRYFDFRRQALGLENLHFFDTYVPIVKDVDFQMPYQEAVDTCVAALAPLGEDYTRTMATGLNGSWVDRYENRGKRSGAYSSGCYDSPPYILLNYEAGNINSLYTLIHEAGHSMHTHYSCRHQPYVYHGYTIFVAEVASTFNETLLSAHLMARYRDDPRMRAYLLNREIDNIRATLFRQTMFAEFELEVHRLAENQQPLTLEALTVIYRGLLEAYFGDRMVIDDVLALECLRIPHFYSAYYVYKYATGISAAIALAAQVMEGAAGARERYLKFLTLGGSRFPLEELAVAGVDMASPAPIEQAIAHFDRLVTQLEAVYSQL
ncbi:MAG: oligoendopeptidase F [Desulfobacterales bacterium]|nr:oligoendopeptidase F [Desulfobacterales bacterium]